MSNSQNDGDSRREKKGQRPEGFAPGQVAEQPFPNQEVRRTASAPHPRKRDVNRDWDVMPRGSLATDY